MKAIIFRLLLAIGVFVCAHGARAAETAPVVVVSVKPLYGLVAAVMEGVAEPALLIRGAASPHSYTLRPSDRTALEKARLVFWIGPSLETFLARPLGSLDNAHVVAVSTLPGLTLLPARAGGLWEDHADHVHADHVHAGQETNDAHLWLDIGNAKVIVQNVAQELRGIDPAHAALYARNAETMRAKLDALDVEIRAKLTPVGTKPFIVFHDSLQYLEARYGLRGVGAVTVSPDRAPGAARIDAIQDRIANGGVACLFSEPPFEPKLVSTLAESGHVKTGVIDPEGASLAAGPALYINLMRGLTQGLSQCLGGPSAEHDASKPLSKRPGPG